MQTAGRRLMARPRLGRDVFLRGAPGRAWRRSRCRFGELGLYELLQAYGDGRRRSTGQVLAIEPSVFHSMDDALKRLARFLGRVPDWRELTSFLPDELGGEPLRRSALAATFAAALELARAGRVELRQDRTFGPIYLRSPGVARASEDADVSERAQQLRLVEALLFAAAEPLTEAMLEQRLATKRPMSRRCCASSPRLRRTRRQSRAAGRRLGFSHRSRSCRRVAHRAAGRAQIVARRGRDSGGDRLPSAGHPRRDRGDPRGRSQQGHARRSDGSRLGPTQRPAR